MSMKTDPRNINELLEYLKRQSEACGKNVAKGGLFAPFEQNGRKFAYDDAAGYLENISKDKREFLRGIVYAAAWITQWHGQPSMAVDMLRESGLHSLAECAASGADEYDLQQLTGKSHCYFCNQDPAECKCPAFNMS